VTGGAGDKSVLGQVDGLEVQIEIGIGDINQNMLMQQYINEIEANTMRSNMLMAIY